MNEQSYALRRQRNLGEIIEAALNVYVQNFRGLFLIAAVVVPLGVANAALQGAIEDDVALATVAGGIGIAQGAVNLLAGAALIASLFDIDNGRPAEFSPAYDVAFERFWTLLLALLRALFHIILLMITIIGIPWAINRSVRWLFIEQAVILDGANWKDALSTSANAVDGSWWRTLGIAIVISIIAFVPVSVVSALFTLAPLLVSGTITAILNAVALPFAVTAMTMLYFDLKVRKVAAVDQPSDDEPS